MLNAGVSIYYEDNVEIIVHKSEEKDDLVPKLEFESD